MLEHGELASCPVSHPDCKQWKRPGNTDNSTHSPTLPPSGWELEREQFAVLKHAHCCIMHGHLHLHVLSNRLTMLPWRVSSVAARVFGTSTSHGQEEEDRSLSRPCAGWMLASSGRTLAPFLDLSHLQCSIACSMQKLEMGKQIYLLPMILR